jgi:DNA polymerase/3'-5' exonuclease PolX
VKIYTPYAVARNVAHKLQAALAEYPDLFSRVEVAGSVRRAKQTVGDIEIVAQAARNYRLDSARSVLGRLKVHRGEPNKAGAVAPWGEKYYRGVVELAPGAEIGLDLFVVTPPADWGVIYLIRTGSAEFSHAVVTRLHRWGLESDQGRIVRASSGEVLSCPTEQTFFRYARMPWIPPPKRDMALPEIQPAFQREWQPGEDLFAPTRSLFG